MTLAEAPAIDQRTPAAGAHESYPGAQSVSRAIALLKSFSDAQPEWSLGELSQHVGLNKATVHRLLAALEADGFIVRNPRTGDYRLGPEMLVLGGVAIRSNDLRTISRAELVALADATGETSTLEVLSGAQVIILDEVSTRHFVGMAQDVGALLPAHATSTGKLLLACGGDAALNALRGAPLRKLADRTTTSLGELLRQLADIRSAGFAMTADELENGFTAVAAPVRDYSGAVVAAVSIGGPTSRLKGPVLDQALGLTCRAAASISSQLGHRGEHQVTSERC